MSRFILAAALCGGLTLGSARPVAAGPANIDFEEPYVPSEFLMHQAPPTLSVADSSGARLLAQGQGRSVPQAVAAPVADGDGPAPDSAGLSWLHEGAPGGTLRVIPGSQWSTGGGCALWNWNSC